jgi:hypothetical protein
VSGTKLEDGTLPFQVILVSMYCVLVFSLATTNMPSIPVGLSKASERDYSA